MNKENESFYVYLTESLTPVGTDTIIFPLPFYIKYAGALISRALYEILPPNIDLSALGNLLVIFKDQSSH